MAAYEDRTIRFDGVTAPTGVDIAFKNNEGEEENYHITYGELVAIVKHYFLSGEAQADLKKFPPDFELPPIGVLHFYGPNLDSEMWITSPDSDESYSATLAELLDYCRENCEDESCGEGCECGSEETFAVAKRRVDTADSVACQMAIDDINAQARNLADINDALAALAEQHRLTAELLASIPSVQ